MKLNFYGVVGGEQQFILSYPPQANFFVKVFFEIYRHSSRRNCAPCTVVQKPEYSVILSQWVKIQSFSNFTALSLNSEFSHTVIKWGKILVFEPLCFGRQCFLSRSQGWCWRRRTWFSEITLKFFVRQIVMHYFTFLADQKSPLSVTTLKSNLGT